MSIFGFRYLVLWMLFMRVRSLYDCDVFRQDCEQHCGANSLQGFACVSNSQPQTFVGSITVPISHEMLQSKGGQHSCACRDQSLNQCTEYAQFCDAECGGTDMIEEYSCELERMSDSVALADVANLQMKCQCLDVTNATPDISPGITISVLTSPDVDKPAKAAPVTAQAVQAAQASVVQDNNCFDYLPISEGTCEFRAAWDSCQESWMSEKYYCAKTCGFCDQPETALYDCYAEFVSCSEVCGGAVEFACYRIERKSDCACIDEAQQAAILAQQQKIPSADDDVFLSNECVDYIPEKEGNCSDRLMWNSCSEAWMREKNYCAKTCGFCQATDRDSVIEDNTNDLTTDWLSAHNLYRQKHCVQDLSWSASLAIEAQTMADQCGVANNDERSWNLFKSSRNIAQIDPELIVSSWYQAGVDNNLDFSDPIFSKQIAPASKVIWKSSREIGCGIAECSGSVYAYCLYDPPGNVLANFKEEITPICD
eukprot:TRINITY_DN1774_c0_g1_i1.p1 TRINITY_DN1774_c0_g1~~TRINITY_DN1774_c0_g1_i1.p1  ORF type:complete len:512 (-),score=43.14 TRINITY_DN1774_c0_g1_i1:586-2031(-)